MHLKYAESVTVFRAMISIQMAAFISSAIFGLFAFMQNL